MKTTRRSFPVALVAVALACAGPFDEDPGTPVAEVVGELDRLFDDVWQSSLQQSALLRVREGLAVLALDDLSHQGFVADLDRARGWLERLDAIDLDAVDRKQAVGAEALRWRLETTLEASQTYGYYDPPRSDQPEGGSTSSTARGSTSAAGSICARCRCTS